MPSFTATLHLVRNAHAGQVDKAGLPYWHHPLRVATRLGPDSTLEERLIALLHDVVEDTTMTLVKLRELDYGAGIIDAVSLLTREEGTPYLDYVRRIAASGNRTAIRVKLADLEDNLSRTASLPSSLAERYQKARAILRGEAQ